MQAEMLRSLYGYNRWATERVLEAAGGLTPEQLDAPGGAGRGSIRETLLHLVHTQRSWLVWWNGSLSAAEAYGLQLDADRYPDLTTLRAYWEEVEQDTRRFLDTLTDADAARVYTDTLPNGMQFSMALWKMMLHVANHGTQHRSEVAAMLTGFGHSPGELDALGYFWTSE